MFLFDFASEYKTMSKREMASKLCAPWVHFSSSQSSTVSTLITGILGLEMQEGSLLWDLVFSEAPQKF